MAITTQLAPSVPQQTSFIDNGFCCDTSGGVQFPLQRGVPIQSIYTWNIIPAEDSPTCLVSFWNSPVETGVFAPLATGPTTGTGVVTNVATPITYLGSPCIQLDCERSILMSTQGDLTLADITVTITGYDYRGVEVISTWTIDEGSSYSSCPKSFSIVKSIYVVGNPSIDIAFGTNDVISIPYYLVSKNSIYSIVFDGEPLGTENIYLPNIWRTTPPTAIGGAARPAVVTGANGTGQLSMTMFVYGSDSETNANLINLHPSSLALYYVQQNSNDSAYAFPYLTPYDLVGVQYPGNADFIAAYNKVLASTS